MSYTTNSRPRRLRPAKFCKRCVQCNSDVTPDSATVDEVEEWFGGIGNWRYGIYCDYCSNPARSYDWD